MNTSISSSLRAWVITALFFLTTACSTSLPKHESIDSEVTEAAPPIKLITPSLVKTQRQLRERQSGQDITRLIGRPTPYLIEGGDILSIVVWGHPELATAVMATKAPVLSDTETAAGVAPPNGFVVNHRGLLQFPYAGELQVSGLTEEQARNLLTTRLAHYFNKPSVTLRVQAFRSKRIYVDGEVKAPGLQAINDIPMTLVEALNRAGGVLPTGDQSQMMIVRDRKSYTVNLPQLVQRGIDPATIMLKHGDLLRVLSRDESKVFVAGEVVAPKSMMMHNGRLTLNEALGESGGINPVTGDRRQVYVVRKSEKESMVFQLDANSPGALAVAENFELNPKDLVYVAATPLTNWHRTISLIFPSALSSAIGAGKQ